jgi:purine-binding chemotaxis protein CheW
MTAHMAAPGNSTAGRNAGEHEHLQYRLVFRAGAQLCAVPLDCVVEVMRELPIKPVAGGPRFVCGLCIIRGEPVPVVDTGLLVGDRATGLERLITVRTGSRTIALAAEAVLGVWAIGAERLSQLPPLLRDAATDTIAAIGTLDAELLFLLRTARIVPDDLFDRLVADRARL